MIKKILYFIPCIFMTIFSLIVGITYDDFTTLIILASMHVIPTFFTGLFLAKHHPYASVIGIIYAVALIGFKPIEGGDATSQVPLAIIIVIYYLFCSWLVKKDNEARLEASKNKKKR